MCRTKLCNSVGRQKVHRCQKETRSPHVKKVSVADFDEPIIFFLSGVFYGIWKYVCMILWNMEICLCLVF